MMDFFIYSLKSGICLLGFYLLFKVLFQKSGLHTWNRFYLLFAAIISLVIPLVQLPDWTPQSPMAEWGEQALDNISPEYLSDFTLWEAEVKVGGGKSYNFWKMVTWVYVIGILLQSTLFLRKLWKIHTIISGSYLIDIEENTKIHYLDKLSTPFSFFNHVFLGKKLNDHDKECIVAHEVAHIKLMHSYDVILFELLKCIFWWNPLWKAMKNELTEIHEYQVDKEVSEIFSAQAYSLLLLKLSQNNFSMPVASHFANVSLKNRIKMIKKNQNFSQNHRVEKGKFLWIIPLLTILLFSFSNPLEIEQIVPKGEVKLKPLNYLLPPKAESSVPSILPLERSKIGKVTAKFGMYMHPILKVKKHHSGIDFSAPTGTLVFATAPGKVILSENQKNWGKRIIVQHADGYQTHYGHMSELLVEEGEMVQQGEEIGKVGNTGVSTGPHLHYAIKLNDKYVDPMDYFIDVSNLKAIKGI